MDRREADIFACLADAFVAPVPPLPPVGETDAVAAFGRWLAAAPAPNRAGLRALLYLLELAPRLLGAGARLRRLDRAQRTRFLERIDRGPLTPLLRAVRGLAHVCFYGDREVSLLLGYDAAANVRRGRELRAREGRW